MKKADMKSKTNIILLILLVVLGVFLVPYLQHILEYNFYSREHQQLFLLGADNFWSTVIGIGGCAEWLSQYAVQYFTKPLIGPFVSVVIALLAAYFLWLAVKKVNSSLWLFPLCLFISLLQLACLSDSNYYYSGLIAFFIAVLFFYLYSFCRAYVLWVKLLVALVLTLIVYCLAGPIALPFALAVGCLELASRTPKAYVMFIPTLAVAVFALFAVHQCWVPDIRFAFWPDAYYHPLLEPTVFFLYSWIAWPLLCLLSFIKFGESKKIVFMSIFMLIAAVAVYFFIADSQKNADDYRFKQVLHLIEEEQWDQVIEVCKSQTNNSLFQNALNLSLSKKGQLLADLFKYRQSGMESLAVKYMSQSEVTNLLSKIYFQMGDIAAAQDAAFDAQTGVTHGLPASYKMLVQTNLVNGAYPVAEKYIALLEKTRNYKEWATAQRKFLYNDEAVLQDDVLGVRRRSLPKKNQFVLFGGYPSEDLIYILEANPDNLAARDYMFSNLLLSRDNQVIRSFVEKYTGTPVLANVPELLQEAIVSIDENNPEYCRAHGVSDEVLARYDKYREKFLDSRNARRNPASDLAKEYGRSYWYYLMFTK